MISPEGLSVPALLDAAAERDREAEVAGHCLEQLAAFKVPRHVRFVTEWPMSGTKIQKARLRQRIADELAAASVTEAPRMSRPAAQAESA